MLQLENPFQPLRLEKFARRLILNDIKPRIKSIKQSNRLYQVDDKFIGELPIFYGPLSQLPRVFPREWTFSENGHYHWVKDKSKNCINSLQLYFGINLSMIGHCFIVGAQQFALFGGRQLTQHSTSQEIGWNIIHLIQSQVVGQDLLTTINVEFSKN